MSKFKKGNMPWSKLNPEKMPRSKKHGMYGQKHSEKTRQKMSRAKLGKPRAGIPENWKRSEETIKKIKKGNKGKRHSEETKRKMSISQTKRYDKIGRKAHKRYIHSTSSKKYKEWRMKVFLRDNFACQFCSIRGVYLEAHHIKGWAKYPKLRYEVENGVTLCGECHKLTRKKTF